MKDNERMTCLPAKKSAWRRAVRNNQDAYGHATVLAAAKVGAKLDEGATCKEASDAMYGCGLTGFLAGCVASMVSQCHARGDDFRKWWNLDNQIRDEGEKANEGQGVLNPAVICLGQKES